MFKKVRILYAAVFILMGLGIPHLSANPDVDWTVIEQIDIGAKPSDVATTTDGKMVFFLSEGEILVYSTSENKIIKHIPVDKAFDRITSTGTSGELILTGSTTQTMKIIRVDQVYDIDISGLAFKGAADAPVIIAVFDDYQ